MPYYLCKVVGTGKEDDSRRPYISKYPVDWKTVYDDMPSQRGCLVFCPNPTLEMEADPAVHRIDKPDLDGRFNSLEFNRLKTLLTSQGVDVSDNINRSDYTVRQIIHWIGKRFFDGFDINSFSS